MVQPQIEDGDRNLFARPGTNVGPSSRLRPNRKLYIRIVRNDVTDSIVIEPSQTSLVEILLPLRKRSRVQIAKDRAIESRLVYVSCNIVACSKRNARA